MKTERKVRGWGAGLFVVAMLTASLVSIFYFGWRVIGLAFPPFDLFDWVTRQLPGPVIASGISTMVTVIRALHLGPTADTAKLAEQGMAIAGFFVTGLVAGMILFYLVRSGPSRSVEIVGLGVGFVLGLAIALISLHAGQTTTIAPIANALWVVGAFLLWGWVISRSTLQIAPGVSPKTLPASGADQKSLTVTRIDRRQFLIRLGGTTAAITVAGAVVGELAESRSRKMMQAGALSDRWSSTHALPNADAAVKPVPGTRPEFTPLDRHYRIDINTTPPAVNASKWRLHVSGLVEAPLALALEDLRRYEPLHQFVTLSCISNPVGGDLIGTTRWTGVSLQRLLPDWRLKPGASHLKIHAADEFFEIVPIETIKSDERVMLTYAWDGVPLTQGHGFPLRIYIPDVHGMKQPKWITAIEVTDHWEPGYWVSRGWDKTAQMKATSVIDVVAMDMNIIQPDSRKRLGIGGIAHAGARGISKVEVQVDDGPWQPATLRTPLSDLTWVIWRFDWPYSHGKHTFTVRCYDNQGTPQIVTQAPPEPNGATGLYNKTQMF